jgi:competence ComEA-like helix-hairpin-helix protein
MQPKKNNTLRAYFTLNARERRAMLLLLFLIIIFFIAPHLIPNIVKPKAKDPKPNVPTKTDSGTFKQHFSREKDNGRSRDLSEKKDPIPLYPFDPNTLSVNEWIAFGVREKTAQTILRYLENGGHFNKPEDLRKIWGLSEQLADQLIPYVQISRSVEREKKEQFNIKSPAEKQIDVNAASQEEWESLRGIGPGMANRIIKFRDKLGGFISVDQLGQTYGLPDSTFQQIKGRLNIGVTTIRLLNINQLSAEELSKHPYIHYKAARAIVQYREQHGKYHSPDQLKKIESLTSDVLLRLEPYITTD